MSAAPIPATLAKALRVLLNEGLEDWAYNVREAEGKGWDGPRVAKYSHACNVVKVYAAPAPAPAPPLTYAEAVDMLPVHDRERILAAIAAGRPNVTGPIITRHDPASEVAT